VALPDTQFYSASSTLIAVYRAQTTWAVAQHVTFVTHLGDLTDSGTVLVQWQRASAAESILDSGGIPNSVVRGNHDAMGGAVFDQFFPVSRYAGSPWYAGHLGGSNQNNFEIVSNLLFVSLDVDPTAAEVKWAAGVIDAHPTMMAVITTHKFLTRKDTRFPAAQAMWNSLVFPKVHGVCRNIVLILSGHEPGEQRRVDKNACGRTVPQLMSDFQGRTNGGTGWLRIMTFRPAMHTIDVQTYSPVLGRFETDANSQFTLPLS